MLFFFSFFLLKDENLTLTSEVCRINEVNADLLHTVQHYESK